MVNIRERGTVKRMKERNKRVERERETVNFREGGIKKEKNQLE